MIFASDGPAGGTAYAQWLAHREQLRERFAKEYAEAQRWRDDERERVGSLRDTLAQTLQDEGVSPFERFTAGFKLQQVVTRRFREIDGEFERRTKGMSAIMRPVSRAALAVDVMRAEAAGRADDVVLKTLCDVELREDGERQIYHRSGVEVVRVVGEQVTASNNSSESILAAFLLAKEKAEPPIVARGSDAFVEGFQRLGKEFGVEVLTFEQFEQKYGERQAVSDGATRAAAPADAGASSHAYGDAGTAAAGADAPVNLPFDRAHPVVQRVKAATGAKLVTIAPMSDTFSFEGDVVDVEPTFWPSGEAAAFIYRAETSSLIVLPVYPDDVPPLVGHHVELAFDETRGRVTYTDCGPVERVDALHTQRDDLREPTQSDEQGRGRGGGRTA